ncbi:alcohol dehydrogenase [Klebsiella pneumoniae]|uniref:Alcohol dehydrogenase n=1 Tax=Klebsiella pneumoniae TaxID=573 RepID=A0A4P0Y901_KLEPN|nr:alcohol dehydrogenase [Klebsiella pneumoniae]
MPATTKILIGEVTNVDESEPFAHEKLVSDAGYVPAKISKTR